MNQKNSSGKPLSNMELSAFCGQTALILKSGISALEGLNIMLEDAENKDEKALLDMLINNMQESGSLYTSMEQIGLFPAYMLHMVRIGEETGTLDEVMEALKTHYEREESISRSIRSAVTYPMIMTGMMIIVVLVLLIKVLPVFNQVFMQLGTEMTGFSRALMNMGGIISNYYLFFIILLVLLAAFALYGTRTDSGRTLFRKLGYKLPAARKTFEETAVCRFAGGMALTLSSGLNPEHSMELVNNLNEDPFFQKKLDKCQKLIDEGEDLSRALYESGIFTGMYARMASVGGKTGSMDKVMNEIASLCQDEIDSRMNNALAVLEPTLVIILSLIVGVILLSVMLPLMGIMSGI